MKVTKRMLTIKFNMKDLSVIDVIQEIKFASTFYGLILSQSNGRCDDCLVRIPNYYLNSLGLIESMPILPN